MSTSVLQRSDRAAPLQLSLLGGFDLRSGADSSICLSNKAMLLLALLALSRGRTSSRDRLTALLWSERAEPQARASLRQALWELRLALRSAAPDALRTERAMISLDSQAVAVDVHRFEELVTEANPASLEEAANLYRGELLDGVRIADPACEAYVLAERVRLHDLAINALDRLLDVHAADGAPERVTDAAHRLLALDPLHEPAHRALMLLWARKGRNDLALRQYSNCHEALRRELEVVPQPETSQLANDIRRGGIAPSPTSASPVTPIERPQAAPGRQAARPRRRMAVAGTVGAAIAASLMVVIAAIDRLATPHDSDEPLMSRADASDSPLEPGREASHPVLSVVTSAGGNEDGGAARVDEALRDALLDRLFELGHGESALAGAAASGAKSAAHYKLRVSSNEAGSGSGMTVALLAPGSERALSTARYGPDLRNFGTIRMELGDVLLAHAAAAEETSNAQAAEAFARGWHHYRRHELTADRAAFLEFTQAIRGDPSFARAHAALAALFWRCWLTRCGWGAHLGLEDWPEAWDRAEYHLARAMRQPTPLAHQVASRMALQQGRIEEALAEAEKALAIDPEDGDSFANLAEMRTLAGTPFAALNELQLVEESRLSGSPLFPRALGRALFAKGQFSEAAAALEQAVSRQPDDKTALELLAATYGHLGRREEAAEVVERLTELVRQSWGNPMTTYRIHMAEFDAAMHLPGDRSLLLDGLRLAGVRE